MVFLPFLLFPFITTSFIGYGISLQHHTGTHDQFARCNSRRASYNSQSSFWSSNNCAYGSSSDGGGGCVPWMFQLSVGVRTASVRQGRSGQ